jgi:hypothetical protein
MVDANNGAQRDAGLSLPANPHPLVDATQVLPDNCILGDSPVSTLQAFSESPFCLLDATILGAPVYAHQLGHNLGCQHNHETSTVPPEGALFPDSFGFQDNNFRTVMAYPYVPGNIILPGYSNPNKTWAEYEGSSGAPTGKAFDFDCTILDGDGTDAEYIGGTGQFPPSSPPPPCP